VIPCAKALPLTFHALPPSGSTGCHTFRGAANALPEPRDAAVADVTGDKKNDLIVLVHDRILVYPQE
jgi:hypothetical protein